MTTTAQRHYDYAIRSAELAEAYGALAGLVANDDRFAAIREMELNRLWDQLMEYTDDAQDHLDRAHALGYRP